MLKLSFPCLLAVALMTVAGAADKAEKLYPEHGKVTAMIAHGDYRPKPGGLYYGVWKSPRVPHYVIETTRMDYVIEGKSLAVGDEVSFRIKKEDMFVQVGGKERKYRLVGQQLLTDGAPK
jgi:hypothetical protein